MTYITHKTKTFDGGGETTVTALADGDLFAVKAMTRFSSGNYYSECDEGKLTLVKAKELFSYYTR